MTSTLALTSTSDACRSTRCSASSKATPSASTRTSTALPAPEGHANTWKPPEPREELIWAAVDLDGTLAESVWPQTTIGNPIWRNVDKAAELRVNGLKIVIHTARGWEDYEMIESWLDFYHVPYDKIVCAKLLARVYVDDKAVHESEESWLPRS